MYFRQILHDERSCASYVIGCPTFGLCAVVDPQGHPGDYVSMAVAAGLTIGDVIETHVHADHVSCAHSLATICKADLHYGPGAAVGFDHHTLEDGRNVSVGNQRLRCIHTPGHTAEHVCLVVNDWFVLTGDTLFVGDVGRVDLSLEEMDQVAIERRAGLLYDSLQRLLELPDHTEVFPGHFAGSVCGRGMDGKAISTIGRERRFNPSLQLDKAGFVAFQTDIIPSPPADFHLIKAANGVG